MVDYDCSSLPPKVVGPVHGFLDIKIDQVIWNRRKNTPIKIKINWWGQDRSEFVFRLGNKNAKTLHTYSIHTTIPLFRDYLKNCIELSLSVVDEQMGTLIGTCTIKNLNSAIGEVPNEQFYPIVNEFNSVIGKLRVNFRLCLITEIKVTDQKSNYDRLKSSSTITSKKISDEYLSSDSDSYVHKKMIKKVFKRGQRLRNELIETILDNDPLNKDVYCTIPNIDITNITAPQYSNPIAFRNKLPETLTSTRPTVESGTRESSTKILEYLMGGNVTLNEEKQILDKIRNLSPTTSMIKLAADIHFHRDNPSSSQPKIDSISPNETDSEIPSKVSDKYSNMLTKLVEPKSSKNQETKPKLLNYIDSMKIVIHYLKLNSSGWRKVQGTSSTNPKLKSPTFFIELSIPSLLSQDERKTSSKVNYKPAIKKNVKLCSRKIVNEVIQFEQQSIYSLNNSHYLNLSNLYIEFKIYCRIVSQKETIQIGLVKYNVSDLLEKDDLTYDQELIVLGSNKPLKLGTLGVKIQFGCDQLHFGKDFLDAIYGEKENKTNQNNTQQLRKDSSKNHCDNLEKPVTEVKSRNVQVLAKVVSTSKSVNTNYLKEPIPTISKSETVRESDKNEIPVEINSLKLLQALIYIPELIFANDEPKCSYLICRAFWRENTTTSKLCHHTQRAIFNFREIVPILYDSEFLKRVKNNFLVIEVWENDGKNENFLGICKLPLHQFYVAYRDPNVASHLTENKYPVIGFDGWEEIIHPILGTQCGQLHALLAIGTAEQLEFLETSRCINEPSVVKNNIPEVAEIVQNPYYLYKFSKPPSEVTLEKLPASTNLPNKNLENSKVIQKNQEIPEVSSNINFFDDIQSNTFEIVENKILVDKEIQTSVSQATQTEFVDKMTDPSKTPQDLSSNTNANVLNNNLTHKQLLESFMELASQLPRPNLQNISQMPEQNNDKSNSKLVSQASQISVAVENKGTAMDYEEQKSAPMMQETSKLLESLQKALSVPLPPPPKINDSKNVDLFMKSTQIPSNPVNIKSTEKLLQNRNTFKAHVVIENAVHLSVRKRRIKNKGKNTKRYIESPPSTYVTFEPIPEQGLLFTSVVQKVTNPKWNQHFECYLPKDLLYDDQKRLIFKVWNKNGGDLSQPNIVTDSVIGFAALDLTVLPQGLPSIQGWFNILDFSSRCNGQIKINLTPLENISQYTGESDTSSQEVSVPPLLLTPESDILDLNQETSSFSNALKRKFNELDEIRERLKQRLMDVTKSDEDSDNNKDDIDFEHDINTEPSPEDNVQDFDFTTIKIPETSKANCFNTIMSGVSTADSGFGETSTFLRDLEIKSSDRNDPAVMLSNLDEELKKSKAQFDTLFEKLTLNSAQIGNSNSETTNIELGVTNRNICLEDITEESSEITRNRIQEDKKDITSTVSSTSLSSDILNTDEILELRNMRNNNIQTGLTSDSASSFDMNSETLLLNREAPEGAGNVSCDNLIQVQKYKK